MFAYPGSCFLLGKDQQNIHNFAHPQFSELQCFSLLSCILRIIYSIFVALISSIITRAQMRIGHLKNSMRYENCSKQANWYEWDEKEK